MGTLSEAGTLSELHYVLPQQIFLIYPLRWYEETLAYLSHTGKWQKPFELQGKPAGWFSMGQHPILLEFVVVTNEAILRWLRCPSLKV